jgi:hypothetical protein
MLAAARDTLEPPQTIQLFIKDVYCKLQKGNCTLKEAALMASLS